jgi:hypothetical protein
VKLWLDSQDRISREWVLSDDDEIDSTLSYPPTSESRSREERLA